ncbi:MAG TPA: ABC transporter substrate-binding protein [Casimicrobiaceae bacterium]
MSPTPPAPAPAAAIAELAPTGKLRAAINYGNPVLATKDPSTGEPRGVSVDLAQELGRRLNVPVQLVTYDAAGRVFDALKGGAWDVAFLADDPARAIEIAFSPAYIEIEGAYLVPRDSPIRANAEVDRAGTRVVVGRGSAYDLYLTREIKAATIVRAPTSPAVVDVMVTGRYEVAAGVRQQLEADAKRVPNVRLLDGRFMAIRQAMGTPKAREAGARYVAAFVEDMKRSGFVQRALERHRVEGVTVPK